MSSDPDTPVQGELALGLRVCGVCGRSYSCHLGFCPFDGERLVEKPTTERRPDPLLGQLIDDRYEIVEWVGEGGMGRVYRVRHRILARELAIKVLRADLADDSALVARFEREARAAATIAHPNVVKIVDFGVLPTQQPYFVMEWIPGATLGRILIREGSLPLQRGLAIARQIAAGLGAAHQAGVVHRDLKPDNVLISSRGSAAEEVKVVDFGLAKVVGASRLTRTGVAFGTPHYMSPEQACGETLDGRADVYALGVLMFQMLAGYPPFEDPTFLGVLTQQLYAEPPRLCQRPDDATELARFDAVVQRCLRKRREERFASMQELLGSLSAIEASLVPSPVRRSQPSFNHVAKRRGVSMSTRWALGGAVALVVAVALLIDSTTRTQAGPRQPAVTTDHRHAAASGPDLAATSTRDGSTPCAGPGRCAKGQSASGSSIESASVEVPGPGQDAGLGRRPGRLRGGPPESKAAGPSGTSSGSGYESSGLVDPWAQ